MSMNEVNKVYENLVKFIKKLSRNYPEMIEVEGTVTEAVHLYKTMNTGDEVINKVKSAAAC